MAVVGPLTAKVSMRWWSMLVLIGLVVLERVGLLGDAQPMLRRLARHLVSIDLVSADNDD